jgi:predicted nucleic acid-binding protein
MAVDPIFIDTNVLVFATIPASPFHPAAIAALHGITMSGAAAWISRQVLREYLVQLTRPGVLPVPLAGQIAAAQATALLSLYRVADGTGACSVSYLH